MSDAGDVHFAEARDELPRFAISLVGNVLKLHSAASILHCDFKPHNVIWNGVVDVLLDFGNAQRTKNKLLQFQAPLVLRHQRLSRGK